MSGLTTFDNDGAPILLRNEYEKLRARLWTDRATFDAHWQELADFLLPRRVRFWAGDRNRGDKRNQNIVDSTARFSARTLASGLHAGLTSPARPWMKLTTPDPDLAEVPAVKDWLHIVTQRMLVVFGQTNLYNVLPLVYGDMGVFGTAAMSILEDSKDLFRCYSYPIGSYAIGMDSRGLVCTFVREYELTVRQIVEQFGVIPGSKDIDWSNISLMVKTLWDRSEYEAPVRVAWIVLPNASARTDRIESRYLPYTSAHYELGTYSGTNTYPGDGPEPGKFLRRSGFRNFPIMCPRWDITADDAYGTDCPGMTALGDVKQLQLMQRRKAQLLSKVVDPPLVGPSSLRTQKTSLLPGDITYQDVRDGMQGLRPIHEIQLAGYQYVVSDIRDTRSLIQRAFYEDLFLMLANDNGQGLQPITAEEVRERQEEKLLALGPVLERTNDELLDPIIDRVYALMDANGLIPPAPKELSGVDLRVEYISIMAQAQKLVGVVAQDRFIQTVSAMAATFPAVLHKVDPFQAVDNYEEMLGVDPRLVIDTETAKQTMAAQAQEQQSVAALQKAKLLADTAKAASATPLTGDSALSSILSAAGGNGAQAAA